MFKVFGRRLSLQTRGFSDLHDLTGSVREVIRESGVQAGMVLVSAVGSTASVTTIEFEPALNEDMRDFLERLASSSLPTRHSETWGDDNGFSHLRVSLMGPSLTLPVHEGEPVLGTWQQIVVIDHDNRPRRREVFVQVMGE